MVWPNILETLHTCIKKSSDYKFPEKTEKNVFESINTTQIGTKRFIEIWLENQKRHKSIFGTMEKNPTNLRMRGNEFFKMKNYPASVAAYTESARCAKTDTEEFSIAIANRSAAFFHMCEYEKAISDIELALELNYPKAMSWKLHLRTAECRLKLREGKLAEEALDKLRLLIKDSPEFSGSLAENILKQVDKLKNAALESQKSYEKLRRSKKTKVICKPEDMLEKNSEFPFASKAIVRRQSPNRGRYVVAQEPIKKGDFLFVEKAYAWAPIKHGNQISLCDHCCGSVDDAVLPCRSCADASYCSAFCWKNGWIYHRYECPGNLKGLWEQMGVSYLAFKVLLASIVTENRVHFNDVQKLRTNIDLTTYDNLLYFALDAWMVTLYLENHTDFFETVDLKKSLYDKFTENALNIEVDLSTRKGQVTYVGSLLLRYILQSVINSYAIFTILPTESSGLSEEDDDVVNVQQKRIAVGSFASSAMLNHSCDPSVTHSFWKDWIIVKAVKDVAKGDEIFNCYGPHFKRTPKAERQTELLKQYGFWCKCSACANPLFDTFTMRFNGFECQKCCGPAVLENHRKKQLMCLDCKNENVAIGCEELEQADQLCDRGLELSYANKWKEAIPFFERSLAIRQKYLYKYNKDLALNLDALGKCYGSIGDWLKSIWYLEQSLKALEARYGEFGLEIAHELDKITDICFQYLDRSRNSTTQTFKDVYKKTDEYLDRGLEIESMTGGPWTNRYQELIGKKKRLEGMTGGRIRLE